MDKLSALGESEARPQLLLGQAGRHIHGRWVGSFFSASYRYILGKEAKNPVPESTGPSYLPPQQVLTASASINF